MAFETAAARRYDDARTPADAGCVASVLVPAALARHARLLRPACDVVAVAGCGALAAGASPAVATLAVTVALGLGSLLHPQRRAVLVRATAVAAVVALVTVRARAAAPLDGLAITRVLLVLMVAVLCALLAEHGPNPAGRMFGPGLDPTAVASGGYHRRSAFERVLGAASARRFAVMAVGIDGLELIDRLWGAQVATAIEERVAEAINEWGGTRTAVTRVGRDEFALLLINASPTAVRAASDRLTERIATRASDGLRPSISVGWAVGGGAYADDDGPKVAWAEAREALSLARELGGGEMVGAGTQRVRGADAATRILHLAVAAQALRTVHEPIVDLATGQLIAAEALARPAGIAVGDGVAELFTAARDIGALAHLERACRAAVIEGSRVLPNRLPLHLNIAIGAIVDGVAADAAELAGALIASGRAPDQVVLDITDAAAWDVAFVFDALTAYRAQGFRVSIDGIRGVVLAQQLIAAVVPDVLKLDHGTLGRTVISAAAREEVAQLVAQAHALGALVVGKAIETAEMAERAIALGVTAGQGRYVGGRPDAAATQVLAVSA